LKALKRGTVIAGGGGYGEREGAGTVLEKLKGGRLQNCA